MTKNVLEDQKQDCLLLMENAFKYKTNYNKEIYNINNLYKKLNNELNTFYININQEDAEKNI